MAKSKHKSKKIFENILLLFAVIILFFIFLEAFVRVFGIAPQYGPLKMYERDELLDYKMLPNFSGKFVKQEFEIGVFTNSRGLRDEEYISKGVNDFNILALGDSFTWGAYGTELNQTFVKVLERKLNENQKIIHYNVINAGIPGYGTDQAFAYMKKYGNEFMPNLVILSFFVGNDYFDNEKKGELTVKNNYLVNNNLKQNNLEKFRNFLIMRLHSYRIVEKGAIVLLGGFIQNNIRGRLQYDGREAELFITPPSQKTKEQFTNTRGILDEANSYLKSKKIKFVVVIIPLDYQVDESRKKTFIQNNLEGKEFDIKQPQNAIIEWAKSNNVPVIDLMPELEILEKKDELYWKLNGHFNEKGNEGAGTIIFEYLTDNKVI